MALSERHCVPCRGGVPPLDAAQIAALFAELDPAWRVVDGHHLERIYLFPDYAQALAWVNGLSAQAEAEGHHPDIYLSYGKVRIELWTHAIDGLTESDFILAAQFDELSRGLR